MRGAWTHIISELLLCLGYLMGAQLSAPSWNLLYITSIWYREDPESLQLGPHYAERWQKFSSDCIRRWRVAKGDLEAEMSTRQGCRREGKVVSGRRLVLQLRHLWSSGYEWRNCWLVLHYATCEAVGTSDVTVDGFRNWIFCVMPLHRPYYWIL